MSEITQKTPQNAYYGQEEVEEKGLGHDKKDHMNSGVYAGIENSLENQKVYSGI